jgi:very-short-patch-repair endonuclease
MLAGMELGEVMARHGGMSHRAALIHATCRAEVDAALASGAIVRAGHGRYVLPQVEAAARTAHALNGVLCLASAALHHGWEVKAVPEKPHVIVPRKRNVPQRFRGAVMLHRRDLHCDEVSGGIATSRELTLEQCLRMLPYDEALAIADSALRHGEHATLARAAALVRGRGQQKAARVARDARAEAANPFESVTRAICNDVPGLRVQPQLVISDPHVWARPDHADCDLEIVVESDSYEWHGDRAGFLKDVRRYTLLSASGWLVLRFTWEDVMFRSDWVHGVLTRAVAVRARTMVGRDVAVAA